MYIVILIFLCITLSFEELIVSVLYIEVLNYI